MTQKQRKICIEIIRKVLVSQNGYSLKEVLDKQLAEECEGSYLWGEIEEVLTENNVK